MNFLLYGAGGHASVLLDIARLRAITVTAVLDDNCPSLQLEDVPVVPASDLERYLPFQFHIAIGDNRSRAKLFLQLSQIGTAATLVHPFSSISPRATLGRGVAILPGAIVNSGASIHDNTIINTSASIDHHCRIGSHVHICPGVRLAGNVVVGSGTTIGTGASVIPGKKLGSNCIIGAGSLVLRDVPDDTKIVGVPASRLL
jgi:sugar O-acyltransferase (sialic acid O-acetyltransferase NeuD family)